MRVLIVDDEPAARRRLAIMLDELDVELVGEAENGIQALEMVRDRRPDVLLLDIAMPEVDGLDVARHLEDPKPCIVFQTAFDEYALKAFDHHAVDYLVKPVTLDKLQRALERARQRIDTHKAPSLSAKVVEQLRAAVATASPARLPRILVRDQNAHRLVPYADVVQFVARDGVVFVDTRDGSFQTDYTLTQLEDRVFNAFIRPNRSKLVNVDHVRSIASNGDGSATIVLSDGTSIHVTRRRAASVRRTLDG
jgi:DNA-binding LytR/AlgR family response regulator